MEWTQARGTNVKFYIGISIWSTQITNGSHLHGGYARKSMYIFTL